MILTQTFDRLHSPEIHMFPHEWNWINMQTFKEQADTNAYCCDSQHWVNEWTMKKTLGARHPTVSHHHALRTRVLLCVQLEAWSLSHLCWYSRFNNLIADVYGDLTVCFVSKLLTHNVVQCMIISHHSIRIWRLPIIIQKEPPAMKSNLYQNTSQNTN